MTQNTTLSRARIFWFWLPLAAMWLMMSAEQPAITAVVSRLPEATLNLAAFGLTFSFALIIESPVIMLLTAGTALATHQQSYRRLVRFTTTMVAVLTVVHLLVSLTPIYSYILREWVGAPEEIIEISRVALVLMTPWSGAIAFRRLFEGVMIRYGKPHRVTLVIFMRLVATVVVLVGGLALGRWPGAYVGSVALSVGVIVGALMAWLLSRPTVIALNPPGPENRLLDWQRLRNFYMPLALTSLMTMVGQPILSFGLSRAPLPLESLAIWPVVMALVFIGRSLGLAYQEVVVTLLKDAQSFQALRQFTFKLAVSTTALFALLAFTPGATLWYRYVSGLTPSLATLTVVPTAILALVPGFNALASWQRGLMVRSEETTPISVAVGLNLVVMLAVMTIGSMLTALPGAVLAAIALTASLAAECAFLWWQSRATAERLATAEAIVSN